MPPLLRDHLQADELPEAESGFEKALGNNGLSGGSRISFWFTTLEIFTGPIKSFMRDARKIMEHPAEILLNPRDLRLQRDLFGLVFEKMPTYEEIVNGTPKLSYIFELSSEFSPTKGQLVTPISGFQN